LCRRSHPRLRTPLNFGQKRPHPTVLKRFESTVIPNSLISSLYLVMTLYVFEGLYIHNYLGEFFDSL
jgi:hypothetical protein